MFGSVKSFVRKRFRAAFMDGRRFTRMRSVDTFAYNRRGEVASAVIAENATTYAYDLIGNSTTSTWNSVTNVYAANNLNQYETIQSCLNGTLQAEALSYDANGNLVSNGDIGYSYDKVIPRVREEFARFPKNYSLAQKNEMHSIYYRIYGEYEDEILKGADAPEKQCILIMDFRLRRQAMDMKRQIRNTIMLVLLVLSASLTACRYPRLATGSKALRDAEAAVKDAKTARDRCRAVLAFAEQVSELTGRFRGEDLKRVLGEPGFVWFALWSYDFQLDRHRSQCIDFEVADGVVESVGFGPDIIDETDLLKFGKRWDWNDRADYSKLCKCLWHDALSFTNVSAGALSTLLTDHFAKSFNRIGAQPVNVVVRGARPDAICSSSIRGGSLWSQIDDLSEDLNVLRTHKWSSCGCLLTISLDFSSPASGL